MNYFCCIVCDAYFHSTCIKDDCSSSLLVCSRKCSMQMLPFSNSKFEVLLEQDIFSKKANVTQSKTSHIQNTRVAAKKSKPTKHVPIDHFYDINCTYLSPNEMHT